MPAIWSLVQLEGSFFKCFYLLKSLHIHRQGNAPSRLLEGNLCDTFLENQMKLGFILAAVRLRIDVSVLFGNSVSYFYGLFLMSNYRKWFLCFMYRLFTSTCHLFHSVVGEVFMSTAKTFQRMVYGNVYQFFFATFPCFNLLHPRSIEPLLELFEYYTKIRRRVTRISTKQLINLF
jgi:hypothetical protein